MRPFAYQRADTADDALTAAASDTSFLAGGTTLLDLVKLDVMRPARVIDIIQLPLAAIEPRPDGSVTIGALVRNSDLAWHPFIRRHFPLLSDAILSGASAQIRNMATTAGNLLQRTRCPYFRDAFSPCNKREPGSGCAARAGYHRMHAILGTTEACIATHPSDLCVALAVLDAIVLVRTPGGSREIAFTDFHLLPDDPATETQLEPGELITGVRLPPPPAGARSTYLKLRDRESYEFALVSVAAHLVLAEGRIRHARLALGGVATKPWRSPAAEAALLDSPPDSGVFAAAADAALRESSPLRDNAFKLPLAHLAIRRALADAAGSKPLPP